MKPYYIWKIDGYDERPGVWWDDAWYVLLCRGGYVYGPFETLTQARLWRTAQRCMT